MILKARIIFPDFENVCYLKRRRRKQPCNTQNVIGKRMLFIRFYFRWEVSVHWVLSRGLSGFETWSYKKIGWITTTSWNKLRKSARMLRHHKYNYLSSSSKENWREKDWPGCGTWVIGWNFLQIIGTIQDTFV